jgi:exodeoxyribonuclease VII large subunit
VTAVLFDRTRRRVERKLEQAPEPFELQDGIEVRFQVKVDLYEASGSYQLIVEDVDPVHTLGKLALARQEILRQLTERGLRDLNRVRALPALPLRVAVITSWGSDAFNDLVKELEQSGYAFRVSVFDARMQGKELKSTVAAGLDRFARDAGDHDILVLTRGGGSRSDLVWFDDLDLAVAVARHPLKVICGIGHQRDESVLDCIATSVKTPTAAAQLLVRTVADAEEALQERLERVVDGADRVVLTESERLRRTGARIALAVDGRIRSARQETRHRAGLLAQGARGALRGERMRVASRVDRLRAAVLVATRTSFRRVEAAVRGLRAERTRVLFKQAADRVQAAESRLRALDPARVVKRGFAVVRDAAGRIVTDIDRVRPGDAVRVGLRDGEFDAGVKRVRQEPVRRERP